MNQEDNATVSSVEEEFKCRVADPTSYEMLSNLTDWSIAVLVLLFLFAFLSLAIYIEEIVFILRHFPARSRRTKTLWILALFPVFSTTALLAVVVPRSSTIVDIVANAFFATCLYQFIGLIAEYLGGRQATHALLSQPRLVPLNVPPVCCCICLPRISLNKNVYQRLQFSAIQFAIFRPLLMFIAAVLWSNGSYVAGSISPRGANLYISLLNILTTVVAMYGLMLTKRAFYDELNVKFRLTWKVGLFQLVLIFSVIPRLIFNILVTLNVFKCTDILPSKGRGEVVNHVIMTILMSVFGVLGHFAFRRIEDVSDYRSESTLSSLTSSSPTPAPAGCSDINIYIPCNNSELYQDKSVKEKDLKSKNQFKNQHSQQLQSQQLGLQEEKQNNNDLQPNYDISSETAINHM